MAIHKVSAGAIGAYELTLSSKTIDTIEFASNLASVEVFGDGSAAIYFTVDSGEDPSVGGANCYVIPAGGPSSLTLPSKVDSTSTNGTVVKLISSGAPKYYVAKALV